MEVVHNAPMISPAALEAIYSKTLPKLAQCDPAKAISLLARLLDKAIREDAPTSLVEFSNIWRPTVSDAPSGLKSRDRLNVLISVLAETLSEAVSANAASLSEALSYLAPHRSGIFRRIELDLLSQAPGSDPNLVREYVLDPELFRSYEVQLEYWKLVRGVYPMLTPTDQQKFIDWIDRQDRSGDFAARHRRDQLWVLRDNLDANMAASLATLIEQFGPPNELLIGNWPKAGSFGPSTPIEEDALLTSPLSNVLDDLLDWSPTDGADPLEAPSPEGAGRILKRRASKRPEEFIEERGRLKRLEATYLRNIVEGFDEALRAGQNLDVDCVLDICRWISTRPASECYVAIGFLGRDQDWTWAKRSSALLLLDLLAQADINFAFRSSIWSIIDELAKDRDPTPKPPRQLESETAFANQALNSVRGSALLAAVKYAFWVYTHIEANHSRKNQTTLEAMPELRALLDAHLDPNIEGSPAVRAVYGQRFGLLQGLDQNWARSAAERIFSRDPYDESDQAEMGRAAWDAFLVFAQPTRVGFEILGDQYEASVRHVVTLESDGLPEGYDDRRPYIQLAEHIFLHALYCQASLRSDTLLRELLSNGPVRLAAHAMSFAAKCYASDDSAEVREKLRSYIDWRLEDATVAAPSELEKFGWWVVNTQSDIEWLLDRLIKVAETARAVDPSYQVLETLSRWAEGHPKKVMRALEALVREAPDQWKLFGAEGSIQQILSVAKADSNCKEMVRRVASHMIRRGWLSFREFVPES